jgi:lipopolysaccharide transport system permease protein
MVTEGDPLPIQHIHPRRGVSDLGVSELRHTGDLLWLLTARELKLRYVQTVLGPLWVVVNPLVPALLFTFVFTKVAAIDTAGVSYLVLVTAAMTPWNTVSRTLGRGGGSLVAQRHLLTKVYFPRLLVPLSITLSSVVDHIVSLGIVAVAVAQAGQPLSWRVALLPVLMVWTLALALATTLFVAAISVRRRDALSALPIGIQVWLYVSPIAYPFTAVSGRVQTALSLNPVTSLIEAHRWAVIGSTDLGAVAMTGGLLGTIALLVVSLAVFRVAERGMADAL